MSFSTIPDKEHWAIIKETSTYVPGDERSRTNPGHGYPEHTEYGISYDVFHSFEQLENAVQTRSLKNVKIVHVKPLSYKLEVRIDLNN